MCWSSFIMTSQKLLEILKESSILLTTNFSNCAIINTWTRTKIYRIVLKTFILISNMTKTSISSEYTGPPQQRF